jgi:8-oxo-dGTP pyrophosphatase MutT (NUDIX family)
MNLKPSLKTSFTYKGNLIKVYWYDLIEKKLPDLPWQQVYVIGDLSGLVPIVTYDTGDKDNLPGGKTESGESVEQTLNREIDEEINCKVLSWYPLGYQENHEPDGKIIYQLRVRAILEKKGDFAGDIGGSVAGYRLVKLNDLNKSIQYGDIGDRMVSMIKAKESIK